MILIIFEWEYLRPKVRGKKINEKCKNWGG